AQGKPHSERGATALVGGQKSRLDCADRRRNVGSRPAQDRFGVAPRRQTGSDEANCFDKGAAHLSLPKMSEQLLPPKPNELLSTRFTGARRVSSRTLPSMAGSFSPVLRLRGMSPASMQSSAIAASTMPAAPSVWPVHPLVELSATAGPNTSRTARSSARSLAGVAVPCRLM